MGMGEGPNPAGSCVGALILAAGAATVGAAIGVPAKIAKDRKKKNKKLEKEKKDDIEREKRRDEAEKKRLEDEIKKSEEAIRKEHEKIEKEEEKKRKAAEKKAKEEDKRRKKQDEKIAMELDRKKKALESKLKLEEQMKLKDEENQKKEKQRKLEEEKKAAEDRRRLEEETKRKETERKTRLDELEREAKIIDEEKKKMKEDMKAEKGELLAVALMVFDPFHNTTWKSTIGHNHTVSSIIYHVNSTSLLNSTSFLNSTSLFNSTSFLPTTSYPNITSFLNSTALNTTDFANSSNSYRHHITPPFRNTTSLQEALASSSNFSGNSTTFLKDTVIEVSNKEELVEDDMVVEKNSTIDRDRTKSIPLSHYHHHLSKPYLYPENKTNLNITNSKNHTIYTVQNLTHRSIPHQEPLGYSLTPAHESPSILDLGSSQHKTPSQNQNRDLLELSAAGIIFGIVLMLIGLKMSLDARKKKTAHGARRLYQCQVCEKVDEVPEPYSD